MGRRPPHHLFVCVLTFITLIWGCMASPDGDEGSADVDVADDEDEFCIKVFHMTPTTITIYWTDPVVDHDSTVSYYQVSYNVTVRYQATAGQRLFSESHTSDQPSELAFSTFSIPLYSTYSTYVIRVTAVLDDGRIIISRDLAISENKLNNRQTGQNDTMFFQLGLELTDPQTPLNCLPLEDDYGRILLHTRSQLIQNVCSSTRDNIACAIQLTGDRLSCYDNSRLVYVARVIGTSSTSAAEFLEYVRTLGPVEISLHNQTFSIITSPLCPLSIPSAEESNCNRVATTTPTSTTTIPTSMTTIITTTTTTTRTATTTTTASTATTTPTTVDNNSTVVVIVTISCLVGIVIITLTIIGVIVICYQCNHCHHHSNSVDVEKDLFTDRPYSLITNTRSSSRRYLTDEERQWNLPAQSFILPSLSYHKDSIILSDQQPNGHADRQHTIEHHITTDH